jgi:hypothetical protein
MRFRGPESAEALEYNVGLRWVLEQYPPFRRRHCFLGFAYPVRGPCRYFSVESMDVDNILNMCIRPFPSRFHAFALVVFLSFERLLKPFPGFFLHFLVKKIGNRFQITRFECLLGFGFGEGLALI